MLALVTGANGFVGSHLVDELLRQGHGVRALVRRTSDLRHLDTERCETFHGELAQGEIPGAALEGVDRLFHVAAVLHGKDWESIRRANVDASLTLYRRYAESAGPGSRFVFVSSLAAAGPSDGESAIDEQSSPRPQTLYGRSKFEAELALSALQGPELTVVRPPTVYGPRDRATLPLFRMAHHGWTFCVGSAERRISMVHAEDLARGIVQASLSPDGVGTWFLCDGVAHCWSEIADALSAAAQRRVRVLTVPDAVVLIAGALNQAAHRLLGRSALFDRAKARDFTARGWVCSSRAASSAFGYAPRIDLHEGMRGTMEWYRQEGWL